MNAMCLSTLLTPFGLCLPFDSSPVSGDEKQIYEKTAHNEHGDGGEHAETNMNLSAK